MYIGRWHSIIFGESGFLLFFQLSAMGILYYNWDNNSMVQYEEEEV